MNRIIGLIAGNGQLPFDIINYCLANSIVIVPIFIDNGNMQHALIGQKLLHIPYVTYRIGEVGKAIDYFKTARVNEIIFIGGVDRPNLSSLKVDFLGAKLVARILKNKFLGDDKILRVVAEFFNEFGFKVISAQALIDNKITFPAGIIVDLADNSLEYKTFDTDIKIGLTAARALGELDIGQSVIVENKYILAVEAAEGTDNLIIRTHRLQKLNKNAILVKTQKPHQDIRLDVPTIGPNTIELAALHGLAGIAIEAEKVFVVDAQKVIEKARIANIFLLAIK